MKKSLILFGNKPSGHYDFADFIHHLKSMHWMDMYLECHVVSSRARQDCRGQKGAPEARKRGGLIFADRVDGLRFFLETGMLPMNRFEGDIGFYREIAEALVSKGQFKIEAGNLFKDMT